VAVLQGPEERHLLNKCSTLTTRRETCCIYSLL
jgi:hypothetical protein